MTLRLPNLRLPIFARIAGWFVLNLAAIALALWVLVAVRFELGTDSLQGATGDRLLTAGRLIARAFQGLPRDRWAEVLEQYAEAYRVDFLLFENDGGQLAGPDVDLPLPVKERIQEGRKRFYHPPLGPPPSPPPFPPPPPPDFTHFTLRTTDPTQYWGGVRISIAEEPGRPPLPTTLIARSSSVEGGGLFADPLPWLVLALALGALSLLAWLPLVRSITRPIGQVVRASEQIAQGQFAIRLDERRTDELGRLGRAINDMTARLERLLTGQKRFLADAAHELASPIARLQVGLGILENRLRDHKEAERLAEVQADVDHMAELVRELLSFSRAESRAGRLEPLELRQVAEGVLERERGLVELEVPAGLRVMADAELLTRALGNLVRNAIRYAGEAGPIALTAAQEGDWVDLEVRDAGPGVPEEQLEWIFEPFSRLDTARERDAGGVGLGLAIVRACAVACGGGVSARNLEPRGFAVALRLRAER